MPRKNPRTACKGCKRLALEVGSISARGLCQECGESRRNANLVCLVTHSGPYFDHWRAAMAASVGALFLDDERPQR